MAPPTFREDVYDSQEYFLVLVAQVNSITTIRIRGFYDPQDPEIGTYRHGQASWALLGETYSLEMARDIALRYLSAVYAQPAA